MNASKIADAFRINQGLLNALETNIATLARALVDKDGNVAFYIDRAGNLSNANGAKIGKAFSENFINDDTTDQVAVILPSGLVASGATGVLHSIFTPDAHVLGWCPLGAGQTLLPSINANGLNIACDQTSTEGSEVFSNFLGATGKPFTIGRDPAFFFRAKVLIGDVSGLTSFCIGFRRAQVNAAALATYLDYAGLGFNSSANPQAIKQLTGLNDTDTATDTTQTLADATAYQVEVRVSKTGVVTFRHDAATPGTMGAPTTVAAFTFDNGDPVIPFIFALQGSDLVDTLVIESWEVGYLD